MKVWFIIEVHNKIQIYLKIYMEKMWDKQQDTNKQK
jgi:hypothetical protein